MSVLNPGSVTAWLQPLKAGDPAAAEFVWSRYFRLSLSLARNRLRRQPSQTVDAEDVALSAMNALFSTAQSSDAEGLRDRHDLWRLLATCTLNRSRNLVRDSARHKRRDANNVAFDSLKPEQRGRLASLADSNPSPEDLALFADELRSLLERLDVEDPSQRLRQVALLKLDGCTDREIALRMNCSRKTVCARTALIRVVWQSVGAS